MKARGKTLREIERKWRLAHFPRSFAAVSGVLIEQSYPLGPGGLRIRESGGEFTLTVKKSLVEGFAQDEWTAELPNWVFQKLWRFAEGKVITKTRYTLPYGEHHLELDQFYGPLDGLLVLEVEFPSEEAAAAFQLPADLDLSIVREVTGDPRYKNSRLATEGLPTD